jgi:hypothetical protein
MPFSPSTTLRPAAKEKDAPNRLASAGKRRSVPYAILGVALIAACALGALLTSVSLGSRDAVLALSSTVRAGQIITSGDLRSVQVSAGSGVTLIPASESGSVIGRTAAVTVESGSLLTRAELGTSTVPGSGQAVLTVLVKFGSYSVDLSAGAHVAVATGPASGSTTAGAGVPLDADPQATVVSVTPSSTSDGSVAVELSTDTTSASAIAAIPAGQAQLISVSAGS